MENTLESITSFINNPDHHDILAIIKGFRNGAVYGAKIRFPHALVMTFLFRTGSFKEKLNIIIDATKSHSKNLA
ncbi:12274_t:CDS:2, partial [Acaulospora morrowiae]